MVMNITIRQTMLRSQLIYIGLLCPTHGHKHIHIALRMSKAGTEQRDSRGIVTRASISIPKRGKETSLKSERSRKITVLKFLRGIRKRESCG